jgi:hypothetical protein
VRKHRALLLEVPTKELSAAGLIVQSVLDSVLRIVHGIHDVLASVRGFLLRFAAVTIFNGVGGILSVAPSFFRRALHLVRYSLIRQSLVADCFANLFLDATGDLFNLATHLIFIHGVTPLYNIRYLDLPDHPVLNNWSAATDELDEEHDKGDYQQDVDVCPNRVKTDKPHQPEDQQNHKYRPEHFLFLPP